MNKPVFTWPGRIAGDPLHDRILAYLTVDIQKSPVWAAELMEKIDAVASGALASWERSGNAYYLSVYPDYVEIEDDFADDAGQITRIPLETFSAAVRAWRQMLADDCGTSQGEQDNETMDQGG